MKNTSRDDFPVLCCHRASIGSPLTIPAATGALSPGSSFLQRSTRAEFRAVLAGLRDQCPTAMPVVVRTPWLRETILGQCIRRRQRFVVRLNDRMGEPQAIDTLCHEWARNYSLDRLAMPATRTTARASSSTRSAEIASHCVSQVRCTMRHIRGRRNHVCYRASGPLPPPPHREAAAGQAGEGHGVGGGFGHGSDQRQGDVAAHLLHADAGAG